jgi:hypothetical protein
LHLASEPWQRARRSLPGCQVTARWPSAVDRSWQQHCCTEACFNRSEPDTGSTMKHNLVQPGGGAGGTSKSFRHHDKKPETGPGTHPPPLPPAKGVLWSCMVCSSGNVCKHQQRCPRLTTCHARPSGRPIRHMFCYNRFERTTHACRGAYDCRTKHACILVLFI